jgi:hypothetical protein
MTFNPNELPEEDRNEVLAQVQVVSAAWLFLRQFYGHDLAGAWDVMHPTLKLCWSQWWAGSNRNTLEAAGKDVEEVVEQLVQTKNGSHELWEHFSRVVLREFQNAYPLDVARAGISSTPRIIAMDTELLYVHVEVPQGKVIQAGESSVVYPIVLQLSAASWMVLNWASDTIPLPGYPPVLAAEY